VGGPILPECVLPGPGISGGGSYHGANKKQNVYLRGASFAPKSGGTKEESLKKAVGSSRNVAQDEVKVADFKRQFDAAMKALDVEDKNSE
jgi:hypothetical protein